ncbi:hypothetical protein GCK72_011463 [Caenorhabditis remanei]|uniref:F-box domain-containing protein n=1 Tax=Caenorhabditis remanei TaxID=31234 RepID=A0A6A5H7N8_CAERE|nr:hypothetical protein GCK72_011463 [Caenorhabditis remanei]KAF1763197.1 hypothetical protein GCK72_011463 [Caenorhabditis remanei]
MLCLKWFNTLLIGKTEKLSFGEQPEGPIMNMPDLVMRKIMENVDFITMLKLRKVCHAFRAFIDDTKLDNELTKVKIDVTPSTIYAFLDFASAPWKSINSNYVAYGNNCLLKVKEGRNEKAKLIKNQDFVDTFFNDFGFILRNQSTLLKTMNIEESSYNWYFLDSYDRDLLNRVKTIYSIYGCCTCTRPLRNFIEAQEHLEKINNKYTLQQTTDKFYGRFAEILKSRESPILIQNLEMRILRPSHFLNMARLVDMKQLKGIVIRKTSEYNDNKDGTHLILDEIVELDVFDCIQVLSIRNFKVTLPLETFLHIPDLTVTISTLTIEDVLLIKKNMLTSPIAKSRCVFYNHIKDSDTLYNTLGYVNSSYTIQYWYYKIPESDQTLQISRENFETCMRPRCFTWIKTSWISKNAVVY